MPADRSFARPPRARLLAPVGRVLVWQPRPGLGDLIWHLPLIRAIAGASRDRQVVLFTKRSTQADALLAGDAAIDGIVWFEHNPRDGPGLHDGPLGFGRLIASLRACRADSAILLHHGASLALALRLAGIAHRYGYGYTAAQRRWLNHGPFLGEDVRRAEAALQAHAYADAAGFADLREPSLSVDPAARLAMLDRLSGLKRPWTVLGLGCHGVHRQWGAQRFAALGQALLERGSGSLVLAVAAHEAPLAQAVAASAPSARVYPALGWNLAEIMALLADADRFVGNDSGLLNLRAAVGRTAVGLFGASGPLPHSVRIVPVVPPGGPREGMDAISVRMVLDALA